MPKKKANDPAIPDLPQPDAKDDVKGGSGYIGETEKTLDLLLANAKRSNASLLFDEGDSLFKR